MHRRGKLIGTTPTHRVLVTGCPRGGTTFVGHALALPASVDYLHEPLNPACGITAATTRFIDLSDDTWAGAAEQMCSLLDYQPLLRGARYADDSAPQRLAKRFVGGRGPGHLAIARRNPFSKYTLVKDPFAALAVPWFAALGFRTVAVVRHPAAVSSSYARIGWTGEHALDEMASRGTVLDAEEIELLSRHRSSPRVLPALLWRIVTRRMVDAAAQPANGVVLTTHESISSSPSERLAQIRDQVGLPWTSVAERRLGAMSQGGSEPVAGRGRTQQLRRNSSDIFDAALARLDDRTIELIWEITAPVADTWYEADRVRP